MRYTLTFLMLSVSLGQAADVIIYGATPGGIASAISAAKSGSTVTLIEPGNQIGGLVTSGLSHSDFHSFESLSGSFADFAKRVEEHYIRTYGKDSQQVKDCFRGTFAEPKVNLLVLEQMLAEQKAITLVKGIWLAGVSVDNGRILSASFTSENGSSTHDGKVFIDATYEGDLMAKAGVSFHVGREGRSQYNEPLAPEQADKQLQAYNFRLIMTQDPANRVPAKAPPGYDRKDFIDLLPVLESGKIKKIFDYPKECIFKAQTPPLPNGKYDLNDVSGGFIRLSLPGKNLGWPEGTREERKAVFLEHLRDQTGIIYFLQNDESVPANFRDEARSWGFCKDEFTDNNHLPPELYVREARRMEGVHVYSQGDSERPPDDARAKLFTDTIAMGDYGNNCHGTHHDGPRFGGTHTGEFYHPTPPYQIPYGVLLPKNINNLLVPVAVSSTHVGFCALRLEPIWMSLGQAAGFAASQAIKGSLAVQKVSVQEIQKQLIKDRSALTYFSDVPLDSPDFSAVQWWAAKGGFHGIEPWPKKLRGERIHGQYWQACPGHAAKLDEVLTPELRKQWEALATSRSFDGSKTKSSTTRREFITALIPST